MGHKKVCFTCRKAFSLGTDFTVKHSKICPECGSETTVLDQKFKPPSSDDVKKWKVVEFLKNRGFIFQRIYSVITNGSYSGQVKYPETMAEAKEFVVKFKSQAVKVRILMFFLFFLSCVNPDKIKVPTKELAFKKFVARQRLVDLPIHFDLGDISDSLTQPMIIDDLDSLFISRDFAADRIWGIYKDTSQFFIFITLGTASVYIPEIQIFDKHGNKIHYEQLLVDGCGADCGYFCNAIANIYKDTPSSDIKFYARDSVFSYECDSNSKEILGTREHYIKFKTGLIDKSGHISVRTDSLSFLK